MSAEREAAEVLGRLADQWEAIAGQPGGAYEACARELRAALAAAAGGREAGAHGAYERGYVDAVAQTAKSIKQHLTSGGFTEACEYVAEAETKGGSDD